MASEVMRTLHQTIVVKTKLSQQVALLINWSIFVPALIYCDKLWIVMGKTKLQIQAAEMSFLCSLYLRESEKLCCPGEGWSSAAAPQG